MTEHDDSWDRVARSWDRWAERIYETSRATDRWLISALDVKPGETVLALAGGPGDTGFELASRIQPGGRFIGTDLSPSMIEVARRRANERGVLAEFRVMDAQAIDLPESSIDAAVFRFGPMLLPQPERAVSGVLLVLKPGGRFATATWGGPDRNPWMSLMGMSVLQMGISPGGDPYEPGGVFSLSEPEGLSALLNEAGFVDVLVDPIDFTMSFPDFDQYWSMQSEISGPLAVIIEEMDEEQVAQVKASAESLADAFKTDDGYVFPATAIGGFGKKPA